MQATYLMVWECLSKYWDSYSSSLGMGMSIQLLKVPYLCLVTWECFHFNHGFVFTELWAVYTLWAAINFVPCLKCLDTTSYIDQMMTTRVINMASSTITDFSISGYLTGKNCVGWFEFDTCVTRMLFAEERMSGLHSWMVEDTRSAFEMVVTLCWGDGKTESVSR